MLGGTLAHSLNGFADVEVRRMPTGPGPRKGTGNLPATVVMNQTATQLDTQIVSTLRFLAVDMVEQAKSGHPGLPLGAAPIAYTLYSRIMKFDPRRPTWFDRDRFILSAGHGSALLYALLHVFGYALPLEELKRFRQLGSKTPGHPEFGLTPGVEATTGPLGQGFANGVGMAMAERFLAARLNRDGATVIDHFTYVLASDGDLMEGIASEAASLAGHLQLGKLIVLYDANEISLDGPTSLSFSEDVPARFAAYGWQTLEVEDGNDLDAIEAAVLKAKQDSRPSLVTVRTHIGYGSPKQDSAASHGSPLGVDAVRATKEKLGWPLEPAFYIPYEAISELRDVVFAAGDRNFEAWDEQLRALATIDPDALAELQVFSSGQLPEGWDEKLKGWSPPEKPTATRTAGKTDLNLIAESVPWLIGGAADLASSTKTHIDGSPNADVPEGRNIFFGVREHAMGAIVNGLSYHGLRGYGSTFLVFSDYMRGAIRVAALSHLPSVWVFTHDSVAVGEDGPTHQPVEHVMSLRAIPNLNVYRPADACETHGCWWQIVADGKPAALILSRQDLPVLTEYGSLMRDGVPQGGYVLRGSDADQVALIASGAEVHVALEAADLLTKSGITARVVSLPCWEKFGEQPEAYRNAVLPSHLPTVTVEAGVTLGWERFRGPKGVSIGIDRFGESAPGEQVLHHLGIRPELVADAARKLITTP